MRDWNLATGDPLALSLAADFRLCSPDYTNDHIWEIETGGGDPPAISVRTTYGLRARSMRLFPRFILAGEPLCDPATFAFPPRLRHFYPNFLAFEFSLLPGLEVVAEYWVPDSHTLAGRYTFTNSSAGTASLLLELCGQLVPLDGKSLAPSSMQSVTVLAGRSADLSPVIFLTAGPQPGPGPYPGLMLEITLAAGGSTTRTWVQAALTDQPASFELARRTAARPWEAEQSRIERVNAVGTIDISTGVADWDAAFALSQKTAFSLFFSPSTHLPCPSFVHARQPDHGYSLRGDGSDFPHLWSGQSAFAAVALARVLPGAPELAAGLVRNFLATRSEAGMVDCRPGLAGQRGRWLAAPLLANLAWQTFEKTRDLDFLREVQPGLETFTRGWFEISHDRDRDGFPEWDHPLQTGLEDNPAFTVWQADGQGAEISVTESPALAALLCREARAHAQIASALDQPGTSSRWDLESERLRALTEECWDAEAVLYHLRDRDTHLSPAGKSIGTQRGNGKRVLDRSFRQPARLLLRLEMKGDNTRRPEIRLRGLNDETTQTELLERMDFQWGAGLAVATSRMVYSHLNEIETSGLEKHDRVSVILMDFSAEDVSLFLPLSAGIPTSRRAMNIVNQALLAEDRFGRPFGIPVCPVPEKKDFSPVFPVVHLPWNALIAEGLLMYGLRAEAALMLNRMMSAVIQNLKHQHAFAHAYHSESGAGIGERNELEGLAPVGLFLETLGVRIESPQRIVLTGMNPFPWSVTVKYRGLTITRNSDQTLVIFPGGQSVSLDDPTDAAVFVASSIS